MNPPHELHLPFTACETEALQTPKNIAAKSTLSNVATFTPSGVNAAIFFLRLYGFQTVVPI